MAQINDYFHLTCIRQIWVKFVQQKIWNRLETDSFEKKFIVFRKLQDTKKSIFFISQDFDIGIGMVESTLKSK